MTDSALHILIAVMIGFMLIAAGITGRPGSIIGALVDAGSMEERTGQGAVGDF